MRSEENRRVVERFDTLVNNHQLDRLEEFCTPDMVNHTLAPNMPPGLDGTREFLRNAARGQRKAARWRSVTVVSDGDFVVQFGVRDGHWPGGMFRGLDVRLRAEAQRHLGAVTRGTMACKSVTRAGRHGVALAPHGELPAEPAPGRPPAPSPPGAIGIWSEGFLKTGDQDRQHGPNGPYRVENATHSQGERSMTKNGKTLRMADDNEAFPNAVHMAEHSALGQTGGEFHG